MHEYLNAGNEWHVFKVPLSLPQPLCAHMQNLEGKTVRLLKATRKVSSGAWAFSGVSTTFLHALPMGMGRCSLAQFLQWHFLVI